MTGFIPTHHWLSLVTRVLVFTLLPGFAALPILAQTTRFVSTTGTNTDPASTTSWATSTTDLPGGYGL